MVPLNNSERIVGITLQALGSFMYAYIIGSLTSVVMMEDVNSKNARERMDAVSSYILKMELPSDLGRRMRRYFRNLFRNQAALDEKAILTELSPSLRNELVNFLVTGGRLINVALFKGTDKAYWPRILPLLRPCPLMRGEILCEEGGETVEAFILLQGELEATSSIEARKLMRSQSSLRLEESKSGEITSFIGSKEPEEAMGSGAVGHNRRHYRTRIVEEGGMVNILAVLHVWDKCVETVVALERAECYALSADSFYNAFHDDPLVLEGVTEYICKTHYCMLLDDAEAKTPHGAPLFALSTAEIALRTREFESERKNMRRKNAKARAAKGAKRMKAPLQSKLGGQL